MKFKVVLLQINTGTDQNQNLEKGLEYCKKAKGLGADLVLFPEMWSIGYEACPFDEEGKKIWEEKAIDQQSDFFFSFVNLAKDLEINIALTYLEKYAPKPRNSVSVIDKTGKIVLNYSKVFICNFGLEQLSEENPDYEQVGVDRNLIAGTTFDVCTLTGKEGEVKLGAMICADREFPESATELMLKGAEIIVVPNACTMDDIRICQLKTRAFDNLAGIALTNYPKPKENGHSIAFHPAAWDSKGNPQDTLIVEAGEEEGIFLAEFDLDQIRDFRKMEQWRLKYREEYHK
ncbi:carbon-nitrogen hydrolase family protein [Candidatus Daviesbacteria bacterium]|nr:carbon-nitrogen hydrolase family protein [Candidatus Daviesbacteria bacterium]